MKALSIEYCKKNCTNVTESPFFYTIALKKILFLPLADTFYAK